MAKRKSTDKTSKTGPEDNVEAKEVNDALDAADVTSETLEDAADSVAAELDDVIDDATLNASDDATELAESVDEFETVSDDSDPINTAPEAVEAVDDDAEVSDTDALDAADSIEDAEIATDTDTDTGTGDHLSEEEAERLLEEAETVEATTNRVDDIPESKPDADPAPQVIRETVVEQKAGFAPMLMGGVAAAVLGYGVAAYSSQAVWPFVAAADDGFETEMRETLSAQSGSLAEVTERLTTLEGVEPPEPPVVDFSRLEAQIAAVQATTAETAAGITAQLDDISARVEALEKQPLEQAVSPEAIAAYEKALTDMQAEVDAQRAEIADMVETQRAEVAQMAAEAMAAEGNAEEQSLLAASRAALADLTTALDTGSEFTDAVGVLSANGVDVPDALSANAENGIATQSALIAAFPDVARSALSAARSDATESAEGTNRVATFFANQLGARSVAPKDGDDPDAVLSRAEASVRSGDLDAALSELSALPEVAQAAVADWQANASTRLEAKSAADALVQQLLQE